MSPAHLGLLFVICVVWGFTFVAGKAGVVEFPPIFFTGLRYLLLMLVLAPFLRIFRGQMQHIFWISVAMGSAHFAFFYLAMDATDTVSTVAVAVQMSVPFSTLMSIIFLAEKVGWQRWTGVLVGFSGIAVIGFDPAMLGDRLAIGLALTSALMNASGMILMKRLADVGVFHLQAWIATMSWPLLFLVSAFAEQGQIASLGSASWMAWGGVFYTALGASLVGHAGMYYLVQRYDVSLISPFTLLAPVFGILFGVWLWGDVLTQRFLLGGALALGGVLIIALRPTADGEAAVAGIGGGTLWLQFQRGQRLRKLKRQRRRREQIRRIERRKRFILLKRQRRERDKARGI